MPCYNEEESLPLLYRELKKLSQKMSEQDFEFLFIDDGSKDSTLIILEKLAQEDSRIKYFSFSRNFGKEAAIYAGLENAQGNFVAVMDADMQDPPALIETMYSELVNDMEFDCIATRRINRKGEPLIRSFFARCFYKIINLISKTDIVDGARDFRLMTREMVDAILMVDEYNRFSKGIFGWVGFKTKWIDYENVERIAGNTKWSFWKLLLYSFDGIMAFSTVPLAISSVLGMALCLIALGWVLVIIGKTLLWGEVVSGYPSLACMILFIGGIQLLCIGILGQYLAKTYLETKSRPIYILKKHTLVDWKN